MSTPANVHSLESILAVRSALVRFIQQVRDAMTELESQMRRMLEWLEHDRPGYWKLQLRQAMDDVHEAQQALHRCLMFPIADERPSCYEERTALKRAQARLAYCDEKVKRVRHWHREVQHELFEYHGRVSQLVRLVDVEVPQAIAVLDRVLLHLEEYQSVRKGGSPADYSDLALVQALWPAGEDAEAQPAEAEEGDGEHPPSQESLSAAATQYPKRTDSNA